MLNNGTTPSCTAYLERLYVELLMQRLREVLDPTFCCRYLSSYQTHQVSPAFHRIGVRALE